MIKISRYAAIGLLFAFTSLSEAHGQPAESSTVISGFDLSSRDLSVRPGDDFNRYASGHWLDTTVIPPDRQSASGREAVYTDVQAALRKIVEADARDPYPTADAARIGRLYTSFLDESAVERRGAKPLSPDLTLIDAAADHRAVAALMGHDLGGFGRSLFRLDVYEDLKNPNLMVAYLHQVASACRPAPSISIRSSRS